VLNVIKKKPKAIKNENEEAKRDPMGGTQGLATNNALGATEQYGQSSRAAAMLKQQQLSKRGMEFKQNAQ